MCICIRVPLFKCFFNHLSDFIYDTQCDRFVERKRRSTTRSRTLNSSKAVIECFSLTTGKHTHDYYGSRVEWPLYLFIPLSVLLVLGLILKKRKSEKVAILFCYANAHVYFMFTSMFWFYSSTVTVTAHTQKRCRNFYPLIFRNYLLPSPLIILPFPYLMVSLFVFDQVKGWDDFQARQLLQCSST